MKTKTKINIVQNIKSIILALILVAGVGYVSAYSTWVGPTTTPPGNNVDAPINTGGGVAGNVYSQFKTGLLTLDHLITGDLTIASTNPITVGQVLTTSDTTGKVQWSNVAGITPIPHGLQVFNSSGTWSQAGVTQVTVEVWGGGGGPSDGGYSYGGAGGGYAKGFYAVTPGSPYTVTVGAGGTEGVNGGTSSFGSLISATGGEKGRNGGGFNLVNGGQGFGQVNVSGDSVPDNNPQGGNGGNGGGGGISHRVDSDYYCSNGITPGGGGSYGEIFGTGTGFGSGDPCRGASGRVVVSW